MANFYLCVWNVHFLSSKVVASSSLGLWQALLNIQGILRRGFSSARGDTCETNNLFEL